MRKRGLATGDAALLVGLGDGGGVGGDQQRGGRAEALGPQPLGLGERGGLVAAAELGERQRRRRAPARPGRVVAAVGDPQPAGGERVDAAALDLAGREREARAGVEDPGLADAGAELSASSPWSASSARPSSTSPRSARTCTSTSTAPRVKASARRPSRSSTARAARSASSSRPARSASSALNQAAAACRREEPSVAASAASAPIATSASPSRSHSSSVRTQRW